jgi:hypothetical protein
MQTVIIFFSILVYLIIFTSNICAVTVFGRQILRHMSLLIILDGGFDV